MIAVMGLSEADDSRDEGAEAERFTMHWAVFVPTVAIAVLYTLLWFWFTEIRGTSGGMSRAALLVLVVGVPLLMVHAGLRYVNGGLELGPDEVVVRPGFPVRKQRRVTYAQITQVRLRRGLIGRVLDVGTLVMTDRNGDPTVMADLAEPDRAEQALRSKIKLNVKAGG